MPALTVPMEPDTKVFPTFEEAVDASHMILGSIAELHGPWVNMVRLYDGTVLTETWWNKIQESLH